MDWNRWPWTRSAKPERTLTLAEAALFHRPWALRLFGLVNVLAALFYGALGTYGVVDVMFFSADAFAIADMIQLLERSLAHSALGGGAFAVDFVTSTLARVAASRRDAAEAKAQSSRP